MDLILHYFDNLSPQQRERFEALEGLYRTWNERINVISRKDIDSLYLKHVLHALSIAKVVRFAPGTTLLDVGCGGGFPGIPLAILFPEAHFTLVDSIGKKITVVTEVARALDLTNTESLHARAEQLSGPYDFVLCRAVTDMTTFINWVWPKITPGNQSSLPNGILALKGGELFSELQQTNKPYQLFPISDYFSEPFFETKKIIYFKK